MEQPPKNDTLSRKLLLPLALAGGAMLGWLGLRNIPSTAIDSVKPGQSVHLEPEDKPSVLRPTASIESQQPTSKRKEAHEQGNSTTVLVSYDDSNTFRYDNFELKIYSPGDNPVQLFFANFDKIKESEAGAMNMLESAPNIVLRVPLSASDVWLINDIRNHAYLFYPEVDLGEYGMLHTCLYPIYERHGLNFAETVGKMPPNELYEMIIGTPENAWESHARRFYRKFYKKDGTLNIPEHLVPEFFFLEKEEFLEAYAEGTAGLLNGFRNFLIAETGAVQVSDYLEALENEFSRSVVQYPYITSITESDDGGHYLECAIVEDGRATEIRFIDGKSTDVAEIMQSVVVNLKFLSKDRATYFSDPGYVNLSMFRDSAEEVQRNLEYLDEPERLPDHAYRLRFDVSRDGTLKVSTPNKPGPDATIDDASRQQGALRER